MKIEVRKLQNTDIEELSRIEAASFSMPWLAEDFRGLLTDRKSTRLNSSHL